MKKLLLILGALFSLAQAYIYIPVTINSSLVGETNAHFPWTFDLSKITDQAFWHAITAAGDIVIIGPAGDTIPRYVDVLNTTADSGTVSWDAAPSTTVNQTYKIVVIPGKGAVNSSSTFTNSNCLMRYGLDGNSSPLVDACGNYNLSNTSSTLGITGKIGKCAFESTVSSFLASGIISDGTNKLTYSFLFKSSDYSSVSLFTHLTNDFMRFQLGAGGLVIYMGGSFANYISISSLSSYAPLNQWNSIFIVYDGTQGTNSNKVKMYINGTNVTLGFTGTIPTTISGSTQFEIGYSSLSNIAYYDEFRIYPDTKTSGWKTTEYNMIFNTGAVTIGSTSNTSAKANFTFQYTLPGNDSLGIITVYSDSGITPILSDTVRYNTGSSMVQLYPLTHYWYTTKGYNGTSWSAQSAIVGFWTGSASSEGNLYRGWNMLGVNVWRQKTFR